MPLLELEGVDTYYGELRALSDVHLTLEGGRIGLLGPNGAGKSTLLKVLLGLVRHDRGVVRAFDHDVRREPFAVRGRIGYMPEGGAILPELSALDFTRFAGELSGLPHAEATARAHQVLHYVGLGEARYRRLASFSTGMRQRARLAQALVGDPKLLLLDEPTSGLDPHGRDEMLELIADIPGRTGASVLLSTHILPDIETTCDQVVVLAGGEVRYAGALQPLVQTEQNVLEVRTKGDPHAFKRALEEAGCVVTLQGSMLEVRPPGDGGSELVLRTAVEGGFPVRHLAPLVHTLERAFFRTLERADAEPRT